MPFRFLPPPLPLASMSSSSRFNTRARTPWRRGYRHRPPPPEGGAFVSGDSHIGADRNANHEPPRAQWDRGGSWAPRDASSPPYRPPPPYHAPRPPVHGPVPPYYGVPAPGLDSSRPHGPPAPRYGPPLRAYVPPQYSYGPPPYYPTPQQHLHQQPACRLADYRREWRFAPSPPPPQSERFIVLSYNILADYLARDHQAKLYFHIPCYMLNWEWRKKKLLFEFGLWAPDIICLQEVDKFHDLQEELGTRGYNGTWKMRTGNATDGCAIFWRANRFQLRHEEHIEFNKLGLRDNVAQICVFEPRTPGTIEKEPSVPVSSHQVRHANHVVVCNIHVLYNPKRGEIKLGQMRTLFDRAYAVSKNWNDAPVIICGDFNCTPKSPLYNFILERELNLSGLARNQISGQQSAFVNAQSPDTGSYFSGSQLSTDNMNGNKEGSGTCTNHRPQIHAKRTNPTDMAHPFQGVNALPDMPTADCPGSQHNGNCSIPGFDNRHLHGGGILNANDNSIHNNSDEYISVEPSKETATACIETETNFQSMDTSGTHDVSSTIACGSEELSGGDENELGGQGSVTDNLSVISMPNNQVLESNLNKLVDNMHSNRGLEYLDNNKLAEVVDSSEEESNAIKVSIVEDTSGDKIHNKDTNPKWASISDRSSEGPVCNKSAKNPMVSEITQNTNVISPRISFEIKLRSPSDFQLTASSETDSCSEKEKDDPLVLGQSLNANNVIESSDSGDLMKLSVLRLDEMSQSKIEDANIIADHSNFATGCPALTSCTGQFEYHDVTFEDNLTRKEISNADENSDPNFFKELLGTEDAHALPDEIIFPSKGHGSSCKQNIHFGPLSDTLEGSNGQTTPNSDDLHGYSYTPYFWTPMEIKAASGNEESTSIEHNLKLRSVYTDVEDYAGTKDSCREPQVTSYNRQFMGTVDYIWCSEGLQTVKVLDTIPKHVLQQTSGFPTKKWGSDHLALVCELAFADCSSAK